MDALLVTPPPTWYRLGWPSGKASASTAADVGSIPAFPMDLLLGQVI